MCILFLRQVRELVQQGSVINRATLFRFSRDFETIFCYSVKWETSSILHRTDLRCLSQSEIGQQLFTESAPQGQFNHRVAMSVCLFDCVSVCAIKCIFFRGLSLVFGHMISSRPVIGPPPHPPSPPNPSHFF